MGHPTWKKNVVVSFSCCLGRLLVCSYHQLKTQAKETQNLCSWHGCNVFLLTLISSRSVHIVYICTAMDLKEDRKERQEQIDAALGIQRLHHRMEWICMISGPSIMNRYVTNKSKIILKILRNIAFIKWRKSFYVEMYHVLTSGSRGGPRGPGPPRPQVLRPQNWAF